MFSRFHRRTPSNPTSPAEAPHSWSDPYLPHLDHAHPQRNRDGPSPEPSNATSPPPFLPQIERVSSLPQELVQDGESSRTRTFSQDSRFPSGQSSNTQTRPRENHTYSNHQRMPYSGGQRPDSAGQAAPPRNTSPHYTRTQAGTSHEVPSRPKPQDVGYSFVTAADLQMKSPPVGGRRAMGVRLPSPPPIPEKSVSTFEPAQPARSGKARLNLLNPMSLLARRRTAQAVPQLLPEAIVSSRTRSNYTETFDPRIRGTVVHDFSAPRPRRNVSHNDIQQAANNGPRQYQYQRSPNPQTQLATTDENPTSPWSGGNHTPVFTENFDEEQYPAAGPHVRKAGDADLPLPKPPYAKGVQRQLEVNTKNLDGGDPRPLPNAESSARSSDSEHPPPVPPKVDQPEPIIPKRISIDPSSTPPKSTPSAKKGRARNISEVSAKDAAILGLPKHMKSTSSRFSFDMIGAAEQERLLEDRHRQKALEKKTDARADDPYGEDVEDDFDYDNMDDDDGLEERIPGVNADLEEEDYLEDLEEPIPGVNADLNDEYADEAFNSESMLVGFRFQSSAFATPIGQDSPVTTETPRDGRGEVIGFAMTKDSPYISQNAGQQAHPPRRSSIPPFAQTMESGVTGLGLRGVDASPAVELRSEHAPTLDFPKPLAIDDDDLYFDDGIIQDEDVDDAVEFDESVFDNVDTDEYGRPLKAFSSIPTLYSPPNLSTDLSPSLKGTTESDKAGQPVGTKDAPSRNSLPTNGNLAPQPSISAPFIPTHLPPQDLTQSTLAAYQSALAAAAHAAAANGKFRRDSVPSSPIPTDPQPSLIPDTSQHTSAQFEPFSPTYDLEDDFDYDDALSDDPIIAAANAEALASDADGFYGQEFGFYSAPAASQVQYANGGYFGPRGGEGVIRSQSGRVVSREPNLTPITERSEYSNRNSFMSVPNMYGSANLTSPGLSQLAGLMSARDYDYEGDMTLNSLLKLRRGAWGGSQASLHSSNGSPREGSPAGGLSPLPVQVPVGSGLGGTYTGLANGVGSGSGNSNGNVSGGLHRRRNSGFSVVSEGWSEAEESGRPLSVGSSGPGSPTLMMRSGGWSKAEDTLGAADEKGCDRDNSEKRFRRHRHTGSAESISYLKEGDPVSGERWILERRRTGESGEVEVLAREVVSGGRI